MHADVLLPLRLGKESSRLTYRVPEHLKNKVIAGAAVRVPVRGRTYTGIVTELHERALDFAIRDIFAAKDGGRILLEWQLNLARWVADYYVAPFHRVLKSLLPRNLWGIKIHVPHEIFYTRTDQPIQGRLGSKQTELINYFEQKSTWSRKELKNFSAQTLKTLVAKGWLKEVQGEIKASHSLKRAQDFPKNLTSEQHGIVEEILASSEQKFLIHGVTGSGKTEIYLRLAEAVAKAGRQTILMVPEISLTPQLIDYFAARFGNEIAVWHSQLSEGEHEREWWRIQRGDAKVVIGSRSAVFAPVREPAFLILDEEHEWSYKQDQTPFYHARDVAFKIAELTPAKIVLGSATPDVTTMHATEQGLIKKFILTKRLNTSQTPPPVTLVDMRQEILKGNFGIFSHRLLDELEQTLLAGEQAILFLNRRGHASSVLCRECGHVQGCPQCDVSLTYHRFKNGMERMICHHCGITTALPQTCPSCGGTSVKFIGLGTQRVEEELIKRFPHARILRADRDTTARKDSFKKMYDALKDQKADVLIGTQMVTKGLDLPHVTLVGVILADIGLHLPDFRAGERGFQLLTQVAGRAGRHQKPGRVILQTYHPEHPALLAAARHDYDTFYAQEIAQRRTHSNPPFSRIIKMHFRHSEQKKCTEEVRRIADLLKPHLNGHALHQAPALITRKHNHYHWHLFLQGPDPQPILKKIQSELGKGWSIDVDPVVMN